ncbi:uncharacterized protein LOC129873195 [Solanum dulcamara]|uniref:uncharacterized protein LOC129873195 n=1 Tax=Solanum dulcamara TaxID=45834 RepID=UPI002486975B|nr:uncharacterized protein LOC129873195 [Solanum dulcamara]
MSFPWKKLKKTSISQLVKDHVRSQTPLMVETGFPSFLVDLFVKNRRKFMKTSKKKRHPPVVAEPHLSSPSTPPFPGCCTIERSQLKGCQEKDERFDLDEAVDKNMVLIALLKIFLVVVLVLGTKKLVMGITISAFLLYFLEHSGECVYRWLMPVAGAQRKSLLVVQQVWRSSGVKMVELEEKDCVFKVPLLQQEELSSSESSREGMDSEKKEELRNDLLESKRKKSQKSKMKRFLAKKFRRKISNQMITIKENDVKTQEKDKLDCQKSSEKVLDATIVKVDNLARKEQNSASIVLLLVVLVGLTGGRTFALVFTLTWCMMSKQVLLKTLVRMVQFIPGKL